MVKCQIKDIQVKTKFLKGDATIHKNWTNLNLSTQDKTVPTLAQNLHSLWKDSKVSKKGTKQKLGSELTVFFWPKKLLSKNMA